MAIEFFQFQQRYTRDQYRLALAIYEETHDVPTAAVESGISARQVYRFLRMNDISLAPAWLQWRREIWARAANLRTRHNSRQTAAIMGVSKRSVLRYLARHRRPNPTHPASQ